MAPPVAPDGLGASGSTLWDSVCGEYVLEAHESRLLLEMCRTTDVLDVLAAVVAADGVIAESGRVHPALVEARQLRIAFARLVAALRLPAGEDSDHQANARRPQRRVGARGVYHLRGLA